MIRLPSTRDPFVAIGVAVALVLVFHANGEHLPIADVWPHTYLALSWLRDGDSTFTPEERPEFFHWQRDFAGRRESVDVQALDGELRELWRTEQLRVVRETYLVRQTRWPGYYASTFAPGTALTSLPVFAVAQWFYGDSVAEPAVVEPLGKLVASWCVAGSAAFLFLAARRLQATMHCALAIVLLYALGTGVLPTSSQNLWQHAPCELYLAASIWAWLGRDKRSRDTLFSAVAIALATCCRPTMAVIALAMAVYLARRDLREAVRFVAAAMPFALALLAYHAYLFGHPFGFGELRVADLALAKTGRPIIWPMQIPTGLAGLLVSPSRGLLIFSPFLLFSLVGMWIGRRQLALARLRPLGWAVLLIGLVHAAYFDWWGGWSYGCRQLVDTCPVLVLFLVPAWPWINGSPWRRGLFGAAAAASIAIQVVGWLAYDNAGWNNRAAWGVAAVIPSDSTEEISIRAEVGPARCTYDRAQATSWRSRYPRFADTHVRMHQQNVDLPEFRYRLWSLRDSQIGYYVRRLRSARAEKQQMVTVVRRDRAARVRQTLLNLALAEMQLGDLVTAEARLTKLWIDGPQDAEVLLSLVECQQMRGNVDAPRAADFSRWRSGRRTAAEFARAGEIEAVCESADGGDVVFRRAFELAWLPMHDPSAWIAARHASPEIQARLERAMRNRRLRQEVQFATARGDLGRALGPNGIDIQPRPMDDAGDPKESESKESTDPLFAARLLAALGEWGRASALFEQLVHDGATLTAEDYDTWGVALARQQRYAEARLPFERAMDADRDLVAGQLHRQACEQHNRRGADRRHRMPVRNLRGT